MAQSCTYQSFAAWSPSHAGLGFRNIVWSPTVPENKSIFGLGLDSEGYLLTLFWT